MKLWKPSEVKCGRMERKADWC